MAPELENRDRRATVPRIIINDGWNAVIGEISKNCGLNCSPLLILTGTIRCGSAVSSRKIVILCPFGVVQ